RSRPLRPLSRLGPGWRTIGARLIPSGGPARRTIGARLTPSGGPARRTIAAHLNLKSGTLAVTLHLHGLTSLSPPWGDVCDPPPPRTLTSVRRRRRHDGGRSLRYHCLHPDYVHRSLGNRGKDFALRILLVQVDTKHPHDVLNDLARICILADCTLILVWSVEETARYLETYKMYENKPADILKEKVEQDYISKVINSFG
ncbi:DNA excision repair protein ERCC-1, partial [Amblyraja radiata]|uniref:DNA excision repair protein ERCC-1 n=1 Tax=Amblyraja radiata TaxID=386614 RepID=UPI0014023C0D